jgi:hypothetical protein
MLPLDARLAVAALAHPDSAQNAATRSITQKLAIPPIA